MRFEFTVTVEAERTEGKFASRDEISGMLAEALEAADEGTLYGENSGVYEITEFTVEEIVQPRKSR